MRLRAGLAIGLCALLALAGGASARGPGGAGAREQGGAGGSHQTARAQWHSRIDAIAEQASAPQTVGTIERVSGALGSLGGGRPLTLHYPGADYVKVHFSRLDLRPGDRILVGDRAGRESTAYTGRQLRDAGQWAMSVTGDTAVVTVRPEGSDPLGLRQRLAGLGVTVDEVARGLTPAERAAKAAGSARTESICGRSDEKVDAVCYKSRDPVIYANSKPVARLLIDGIELCSAWRVGPNNRMFTNHHCFTATSDARRTEVWFNYECARCGGYDTLRPTKVWGAQVLATDSTLDYTLFTVDDFPAISGFGYLSLDLRRPDRGEELYIPQHPRGEPTAIAMADPGEASGICGVADPAYDGYAANTDVSYYCDTEGGSSGSPVISRYTNKVIALHHFGGCPNSGVRIDLIYYRVADLL